MKVAFYKGTDHESRASRFIDNVIRWWTNGPYSHCELIIEEKEGHPLTLCASSKEGEGVRFKWLDLNPIDWDILEIYTDETIVIKWFYDHSGEKYNYMGILDFVIPLKTIWEKRRWVCSEACAEALGFSNTSKISPNDLYRFLISIK